MKSRGTNFIRPKNSQYVQRFPETYLNLKKGEKRVSNLNRALP